MCAWLPAGMAEEVANAKPTYGRERVNDGDYVFMHKKCSYEQTKKGPAVIIEHRIMSAKRIKEDVEPNAVGTDVSYFLPNYGDAAVMLQPNLKMYVCGLLGVDADKVAAKDIVDTIQAMGDERQMAKGMLIQGTTFHTKKKSDGEDFMGFNWKPVLGENDPRSPSVAARRAELERGGSTTVPVAAAATPPGGGVAVGAAPTPPAPPSPTPPAPPAVDPLAGWIANPNNPAYYYRFVNGAAEQKLKTDLLAGR